MDVLKNSLNNKTSILLKRNAKKQNYCIHHLKQSIKSNNNAKSNGLNNNIKNKVKEIPLLNKAKNKPYVQIQKNNKEITSKELLPNNILIRAFSYKIIEDDNKKDKASKNLLVNKKNKKSLYEYKAQKILEDINNSLTNNNVNLKNYISNYQNNKTNLTNDINNKIKKKILNINNEDIKKSISKDKNLLTNNDQQSNSYRSNNLNININNSNLNNSCLQDIITIKKYNSKCKKYKCF